MDAGITLRDYQVVDLTFLMREHRCMILHDPGGGKTPPVCVYIWWLWNDCGNKRTIFVMPRQLMEKNKRELLRFTDFKPNDIFIMETGYFPDDAKVLIMGPDRLRISWREIVSTFPNIGALVGDEVHMYWSTHTSARARAATQFVQTTNCRFVAMTGSLIKGRLSSAYPCINMIEPRYYASYNAFKNHHEAIDPITGAFLGWQNTQRISAIVARHAIKRSFESIYGPEAKVIITEKVSMKPKQRAKYKEFEANAILELEDSMLEARSGGVMAVRCAQILSHPETWDLAEGEMTAKDEQLLIHLADHKNTGKPGAIFARFIAEQERIVRLIEAEGMTVGLLNGNTSRIERDRIDKAYCRGDIQWIVGSPQVAAVGYNWEHVDHVIFASLDYSDDAFYQAYRRFIRGVRSIPLLITVLQYAGTIEARIMEIIRNKSGLAKQVDDNKEVYDLGLS